MLILLTNANVLLVFSVPLCYVYPAMLHYKACARTRGDKLKDIAMIVLGMVAFVYTTVQTIRVRLCRRYWCHWLKLFFFRLVDGRTCSYQLTFWPLQTQAMN